MKHLFLTISILWVMQTTAQQTNYHFSATDSTTAASNKIWQLWTDVPNWKQWDKGLKDAVIDGAFKVGATGKIIPDKGPTSKFIVTELVPDTAYAFKTKIPFGWLVIKRTLTVKDDRTFFTHDVAFTGMLKNSLVKSLVKITGPCCLKYCVK